MSPTHQQPQSCSCVLLKASAKDTDILCCVSPLPIFLTGLHSGFCFCFSKNKKKKSKQTKEALLYKGRVILAAYRRVFHGKNVFRMLEDISKRLFCINRGNIT